MGNFYCKKCGIYYSISRFIYKSKKYYDQFQNELKCKCGEVLVYINDKSGVPILGSNKSEQKNQLKKRAKQHYNKEIKEKQIDMNKNIKL